MMFLKPDIKPFIFKARLRYLDTPFDVPGDGPVFQAFFQKPDGKVPHIGAPVVLFFYPFQQLVVKSAQLEEEMLRLPEFRGGFAGAAVGLFKLGGIERLAAAIAFVAPRAFIPAERADAFDVPVGEETLAFGAIRLGCRGFINVTVFLKRFEHILYTAAWLAVPVVV